MNHIGDVNKLVSDTPRTDRWIKNINGWHYVQIERCRELEQELNAANERIKRLESVENSHAAVLNAIDNWMQQHQSKEGKP